MTQFPACLSIVDANVGVDTNLSTWGLCMDQSIGFNDPVVTGALVLIAFVILLLLGRQNLASAGFLMFGLSGVFYIMNPAPFWVVIASAIAIGTIVMMVRGIKIHVQ